MNSKVLVTAIIPVFNGEKYLRQAIESVLAQSHRSIELIVIDDGSTDSSAAIAQVFGARLRYHHQANAGLSAAQNAGVRLTTGAFIAFLDCDDLWVADKLALQLDVFHSKPETDMVFGQVEQFYSLELDRRTAAKSLAAAAPMPGYSTGTMLAKTDVFERAGMFSDAFRVGEFLDWYGRAEDADLRSVMLEQTLLRRRIHDNNMGIRDRDKRSDYLRVFKASLDRRRRASNDSAHN